MSCQSKSKRMEEMRKQTRIESPYEITQVEGAQEESGDAVEEAGPSAVKKVESPTAQAKTPPAGAPSKDSSKASSTKAPKSQETSKTAPKKETTPKAVEKPKAQATSTQVLVTEDKTLKFPFNVGEKVVYSIAFFAVEAGRMTMEVKPFKQVQGDQAFHFYVTALSSSVFSLFYSVKDYAESFWSAKHQKPYLMKIYGEESKYVREIQTSFNWSKKTARYQAKVLKTGKDLKHEDQSWKLNSDVAQDVLSALYKLRTYDLKVDSTYKMHVAEKGKDIMVTAKVLRKEVLKTRLGRFDTLVVKPTFQIDGDWKQDGDVLIWLTDDENKIPIGFEAKVKIGTIKGRLHSLKRS